MTKRKIDFRIIEKKWQKRWEKNKIFKSGKKGKKFYCLEMFPYPSGKLHMGHVRNYTIGDSIARFKRMQGFNVLYPMGFDAFGLPAENAAIKHGIRPDRWTKKNIGDMIKNLQQLGNSYDWDRMIMTCDPEYYKWEQLFFLRMLKKGLAYRKKAAVNYCPKCDTVLANEQVHSGKCWRCDSDIEQKELEQWFFKTTAYTKELLAFLEKLDWPESVKVMQKNWIGKSDGAEIIFKVKGKDLPVFTTRADTLFGCTFMAIAPEHELVKELTTSEREKIVNEFISVVKNKTLREREEKGKDGVFTGSYAINPVNGKEIPIFVADYVLEYGTGAIMCVPAHDQRDYDFAKAHNLLIVEVIKPRNDVSNIEECAYEDEGILINSEQFNGMSSEEARKEIVKWLSQRKLGSFTTNYKLKDWLISRQRYWGCPIPVVYCKKCGIVPVDEKSLPVKLPDASKVKFGKGNPLETYGKWINTKCPKCKGPAKRDTDTMDTFVDSSWYFLRYCDNKNKKEAFSKQNIDFWMPINFYIGGIEHACMHLIYARFFTKVLADLGFINKNLREPFSRLVCQGMVLKDGEAMSKSKGNVVEPDPIIAKYGADTLRLYHSASALPTSELEWNDKGIEGSYRFILKLYNLFTDNIKRKSVKIVEEALLSELQKIIEKVTDDYENLRLNLALSSIFSYVDKLIKYNTYVGEKSFKEISNNLILLLTPIIPHICEELYKGKTFASITNWPESNKKLISEESELAMKLINQVISDINEIKKIAKIKADKAKIFVAEDWKFAVYKKVFENRDRDINEITKEIMQSDMKRYGKTTIMYVQNLYKRIRDLSQVVHRAKQFELLEQAKSIIESEINCKIEIFDASKSDELKAKNATPEKPGILLE